MREAGLTMLGGAAFGGMNHLAMDAMLQGGVLGGSILSVGGMFWYHQMYLQKIQKEYTTLESLSGSFQRTHARHVHDANEFTASLYHRVRRSLQTALQNEFNSSTSLPTVSDSELQRLNSILEEEIPKLRRLASSAK